VKTRQKGWALLLLIGLVSLCVACIEAPEMLTLTDDVSNDFTILPSVEEASAVVEIRVADNRQENAEAVRDPRYHGYHTSLVWDERVNCVSSCDLLALHSFWRT
jgi:hypothetical protein